MDIRWYGHTAFELKQKSFSVLIDPFGKDVGLGTPSWKADIVTLCREEYLATVEPLIESKPRYITQPGEYEINDIFIYGIRSNTKDATENMIYKFEYDNHHILHLSHLGQKLTDQQLEQIGIVDVLLLSLGSDKTLNINDSKELIEEIDPRVIIPIDTGLKDESPLESKYIQDFLKAMGKTVSAPQDLFDVGKYPYNGESTDVVVLLKTPLK